MRAADQDRVELAAICFEKATKPISCPIYHEANTAAENAAYARPSLLVPKHREKGDLDACQHELGHKTLRPRITRAKFRLGKTIFDDKQSPRFLSPPPRGVALTWRIWFWLACQPECMTLSKDFVVATLKFQSLVVARGASELDM